MLFFYYVYIDARGSAFYSIEMTPAPSYSLNLRAD